MKKSRRIANRNARKRIQAREHERKRITEAAAALGLDPLPWQVECLVGLFAGPDPRLERMRRSYRMHPSGRVLGKSITLTLHDELRKGGAARHG